MLKVSDDGPGIEDSDENQGLGTQILKELAVQISGTLAIAHDHGTTVRVIFRLSQLGRGLTLAC
jgi:two-component sensor histidine kinase